MLTLDELKAQCRWLLWRYVQHPGASKLTKVPCQPNGSHAKSNDPATWRTYAECAAVVSRFSGVGVVTGDGVTSTDLDDVIVGGNIIPEAMTIVTALNSYTERSPSGTGLLILAGGTLPGAGIAKPLTATSAVEVKDVGFFHTFTGNHMDGTPLELMPRQAEIEVLYNRFQGKRAPTSAYANEKSDPVAVERTIRHLAEWLDKLRVMLTDIDTLSDGRTLLRLDRCPLFPAHRGTSTGIGVSVSGRPLRMCAHTSCTLPGARSELTSLTKMFSTSQRS
ncbi:MAG: hypothetical protein WA172_17275 [Terriglobales bacterium]